MENQNELMVYHKTPKFVPAGQSTQMTMVYERSASRFKRIGSKI